jgi:hypothetical protein
MLAAFAQARHTPQDSANIATLLPCKPCSRDSVLIRGAFIWQVAKELGVRRRNFRRRRPAAATS